jgi:hypothetical protein
MDKNTRKDLLGSVDEFGNPSWQAPTFEELPEEIRGQAAARTLLEIHESDGMEGEPPQDNASAQGDEDNGDLAGWFPHPSQVPAGEKKSVWEIVRGMLPLLAIFIIALIPRVIFMLVVSDPNELIPSWSNDTWHRWQIAYLSKEIGFSQDFLRLWDLKGMEYYWGVIHPFLLAGLFAVTGSVDVMILRWLTIIAGALNIVFIYLLGNRFWNTKVAVAAFLLTAFNPLLIFNDPSGMVEPISFVFLLAGVYFFPRRAGLAGVLLALGAMTRAEAWLFSAGILIAALLSDEHSQHKIWLAFGWSIPIAIYMKYLMDRTGNMIYPIYWNFLANAAGKWQFRDAYTSYQMAARPVLGAIFVFTTLAALRVFYKRPKGYLLKLLGLGTTAFVSGFIGLTAYLGSYEPWFWMTRFFTFPYMFLCYLIAAYLLGWLPQKYPGWEKFGFGWLAVLFILAAFQVMWFPISFDVDQGYTSTTSAVRLADQGQFVGEVWDGGIVLVPEAKPQFTYALGRYSGIPGRKLLSQMYSPIYYYTGGDPFENWDVVGPQMWNWFKTAGVRLLVMNAGDRRFMTMIEEHPERLVFVGEVPHGSYQLYKVEEW